MTAPASVRGVLLAGLAVAGSVASAQDVKIHAFLDGRLVDAPSPTSFTEGGYGKTRYGNGDTRLQFGGGGLVVTAQATPALFGLVDVQAQTTDHRMLGLVESYLRYRPVSLSPWRWSLQAGVFFPPVSLENDGIGWTSPWTITPSAINSWVGEELRDVGLQGQLQWRGQGSSLAVTGALFRRNEIAGNILAVRGWSLSDLTYGLGERIRLPDKPDDDGQAPTDRYDPFRRVTNQIGWHADVTWRAPGNTRVTLLRWDNNADPHAWVPYEGGDRLFAWRTKFWSLGATTQSGPVTLIAQAMEGGTLARPGMRHVQTHFRSAFVLVGWNQGAWRPALRVEHFSTDTDSSFGDGGEHGNAVTAALAWRPRDWLRITYELMRVDSYRLDLASEGQSPHVKATQMQVSARLLY